MSKHRRRTISSAGVPAPLIARLYHPLRAPDTPSARPVTPSVIEAAAWAVLGSLVAAGVLVAGGHGWQVAVLLPVGALGVIVLLVLASRTAVRAEPTPELPPVQVEPDSDLPLIRAELPGDHPAMWIHHGPDSESAASRVRGRRRLR